MNNRTKEAYERLISSLDCGDNSCMYKKSGGMRTNGGCRCLQNIHYDSHKEFLLRRLLAYLDLEYKEENNMLTPKS